MQPRDDQRPGRKHHDKRTQGSIIADAVRRSVGVVDGSVVMLWKSIFTELRHDRATIFGTRIHKRPIKALNGCCGLKPLTTKTTGLR